MLPSPRFILTNYIYLYYHRESTEMDMDSGDEGKTSNWAEVGRSGGGTSDDGFLYDRIASGESREASASGSGAGSSKKKAAVLDDEPDLAKSGLASALQMARNKGYIETDEQKSTGLGLKHLQVSLLSLFMYFFDKHTIVFGKKNILIAKLQIL